jgi:hypothetical protein
VFSNAAKQKTRKTKKEKPKTIKRCVYFNMRANVEEMVYFAHMCFKMQQSKKTRKTKKERL